MYCQKKINQIFTPGKQGTSFELSQGVQLPLENPETTLIVIKPRLY